MIMPFDPAVTDAPADLAGAAVSARICFHCGGPIPDGVDLAVDVDGRARAMCCRGCEAVARTIVECGLQRYYRLRTAHGTRPPDTAGLPEARLAAFDEPAVQQRFVDQGAGEEYSASLMLDGIHCPACCWLIERRLRALPGMRQAVVNFASQRATVTWTPARLRLSAILEAVSRLGYAAHPYDARTRTALLERERRGQLRRLGLAGLLGMQVMMFSFALYFRDWPVSEDIYREAFRWAALLLTVPVLLYSAAPFFRNAWRDLKARRAGMDVPVAAGIGLAFLGSAHAVLSGQGPVYFDSVVMFVFILLLGRYLEFRVRGRALAELDRLGRIEPALASRLDEGDGGMRETVVAASMLVPGDRVLVRPGEGVPADGVVESGDSAVDEAILTGEGMPRRRRPGDRVTGGSMNCESPLQVRVERVGAATTLARISRLVEQGQAQRPAVTRLADRIAACFVFAVLAAAIATAAYWANARPDAWLPITISVLVVSCPCALALAVPAALAASLARSMREGIIVARAGALETLQRATVFAFDKTGTLTRGRLSLQRVHALADLAPGECLRIAAALEGGSEHPIARAIRAAAGGGAAAAAETRNHPGRGVTGQVSGKGYALGSAEFLSGLRAGGAAGAERAPPRSGAGARCFLSDARGIVAAFDLEDELRADAAPLIEYLKGRGGRVVIASGDSQAAVEELGARLRVDRAIGDLGPGGKMDLLRDLGAQGEVTCMVGDGINDAPVLAAAHVSAAMAGATELAQASADLILPEDGLSALRTAIDAAARSMRVIRQNAAWALGYNSIALPLAATGHVAPWAAALGMSLSSLLVVANSARLSGRSGAP